MGDYFNFDDFLLGIFGTTIAQQCSKSAQCYWVVSNFTNRTNLEAQKERHIL